MIYILTGSGAFILFFLFDYYKMKSLILPRNAASLSGLAIFLCSIVFAVVNSPRADLLIPVRIIAFILFVLTVSLLVYSLFLEIPFKSTYADSSNSNLLVNTGTYALCRHPGVLWLFLALISLFIMTGAIWIGAAAVIWTGINAVHVYLQEKFFFCRMFTLYVDYQRTTPMLIPNKDSMKKFLDTFI